MMNVVRQNPCRYCAEATERKTGYGFGYSEKCHNCENYKSHLKYLMSKRKYVPGEPIRSIEELLEQKYVIWLGTNKTLNIEVIKSWQLRMVFNQIKGGWLRKAIKKESEESKNE